MNIIQVSAAQIMQSARSHLRLPALAQDHQLEDIFLAAVLRRQAGFQCPCSPALLASTLRQSLAHLTQSPSRDILDERIEAALEMLCVVGDLLELENVTSMDSNVKGTWVFAAPPTFVIHPSKEKFFILGITHDDLSPLPDSLGRRLQYSGFVRFLVPENGENLQETLLQLGLRELSWNAWHKLPKHKTAQDFLTQMQQKLDQQPACGAIPEIEILDPDLSTRSYKKRWTIPKKHTGKYVARRPQEYGAALWGYTELADGAPVRFLDLPLKNVRFRGCDTAWHLQLAIDHCRRSPQTYRCRRIGDEMLLEFFMPLPMWAQRKLAVIGRQAEQPNCLFAYYVPVSEAVEEERFLQEQLWLSREN